MDEREAQSIETSNFRLVKKTMRKGFLVSVAILALFNVQVGQSPNAVEKEVSFKTEDGWTISGMFATPAGAKGKVPAVIFLHSFDHDRDAYGKYLYPGLAQIMGDRNVATLRIDLRG